MTTVVGLDLSLTSTGIAAVHAPGLASVYRTGSKGKEGDDLHTRHRRLRQLVNDIEARVQDERPDLVVIEQPAFSRQVGHMHDRSGLWWMVVDRLRFAPIPVAEVSPTTLKRYVLGKGSGKNVTKDAVLATVVRRYVEVDVNGNDEADALVLAVMGARHLGQPFEESLPKANLGAMDAVRWPEMPQTNGAAVRTGRNYDAETIDVAGGGYL